VAWLENGFFDLSSGCLIKNKAGFQGFMLFALIRGFDTGVSFGF
jgi:hypothetical protein